MAPAIAAVASVGHLQKKPANSASLACWPVLPPGRDRSCVHKIGAFRLAQCPVSSYLWDSSTRKGLKNHGKSHLALVAPTTVYGTVDNGWSTEAAPQRRGPLARVPDRRRGRSADLGRRREPPRPPRRHHGAGRLPPWACGRASWSRCAGTPSILPMAACMSAGSRAARSRPPAVRPRAAGPAPAQARQDPASPFIFT